MKQRGVITPGWRIENQWRLDEKEEPKPFTLVLKKWRYSEYKQQLFRKAFPRSYKFQLG